MPRPRTHRVPLAGVKHPIARTAVALVLLVAAVAPAEALASERVGSAVFEVLAERGEADVVIAYASPAGLERVQSIAGRVPAGHLEIRRTLRRVAAFAGTVTASGLAALLRDPRVLRIDLEEGGGGRLAQVVPLVGLDAV